MHLVVGDGCTLRCDGSVQADGPAADGVQLTFDKEEATAIF